MAFKIGKNALPLLFIVIILSSGVILVSASSSPARIVNGFLSNAFPKLMKWVVSLKATTKTAITGRPMMKFESGYSVETVFDGSKLGIEPYSVEVLPDGELIILDSANSNLYKISSDLSLYSRPKLISGSSDGYSGHVDGRLRDSRMNHPKGVTFDDRGNIYVADTDNMAIRKISDTGVTTIAGGKRGRGGGHVDGPSEDARFSNDFDVVYIGSSCSLLVIDRGNKAIREIQLNFDDCAYQYGSGFPLGVAVLIAAGFFGYMLALLQQRVGSIVSSQDNEGMENQIRNPLDSSKRPPLIPTGDSQQKQDDAFLNSFVTFVRQNVESFLETLSKLFPIFNKTQPNLHQNSSNSWPVQESFEIPEGDEPPTIENRTAGPTPRKTYPFMTKDPEKMQQLLQSPVLYNRWEGEFQHQQVKKQNQQHQHQHQYFSSAPQTYYEQNSEKTKEIVFGAVQEEIKGRGKVVIKPLDYGVFPVYDRRNVHSRVGYGNGN